MIKRLTALLPPAVLACLLGFSTALAQPTEVLAPAAIHTTISEESHLFSLRINGEPVDVHFMVALSDPARRDWGHMHYAHISARGVLDVEVDLLDGATLNWIRPRAFMVEPTQVDNTVSFRLHFPHYHILEAHHSGLDHALVLFVDELPANAPQPSDPNVLTSSAAGIAPGAGREANQAAYNAARDQIRADPNLDILYIEPGHYHFAPNMRTGVGVWVAGGAYIDTGQVFSDWQEGFFLRGRGAVGNGATIREDGSIDLRRPDTRGQMFLLRQARNFMLEGLVSRFSQDWNTVLRVGDDAHIRNWKVMNVLDWVNNDGINTERARRVLIDKYYVSAGADNSSDKANAKSGTMAFGFERDVQDITRRDGVFYSMAKSQKFGTESDADYMERFLFEDMFVVRATGGPQAHLADRATLRDFTARNWHVDSGSRLIEMNVAPWGRNPTTANLRDMRFENIFGHANGQTSFGTFSESTPIQDVELSNIWQAGQFATSTATMSLGTWAKADTFTVSVDPSIWAAHDRFGRVNEPVPMNAYFIDAAGNWSSDQGPGTYAVTWTVQSGPGTVNFSNAKDPQTTATFSQRGEYVLRLTADDHPTVYDELTVTVLDPAFAGEPVARFIAFPTIPQVHRPVTFDASFSSDPDGTIVSYTWDFGDGTTLTTASPTTTHTFTDASIHEVHLTVTDNEGNSRRIRDWIVVRALERTPFGGLAHTVPGRIQMEHFDDGSPGIAFFDRSTGAVDPNDPYKPDPNAYRPPPEFIEEYFATRFPDIRATADPETPGGHELYDINNPSGPTPEFVSYTMNVTQTGTYEMRIRMNPNLANVDRRFNVYLDDQLVASERAWGRRTTYGLTTVPNIPLSQTGEQVLKIEFLGSLGLNGGINYFDLVRTGAPVPVAAFSVSPERGLAPLEMTVDAGGSSGSGEAITSYSWNFGDGTVIADGNPMETHTFAADGTYTISLTVTNESGNTATSSISYFVGNMPPVASLTHAPTFGEAPLEVTFDASGSSDPDGHIVRFDWDFGDGHTLTDGGPIVSRTYTALGSYTATVTVLDNEGGTGSASVLVQVTDGSLLTPEITEWPVASPIIEGESLAASSLTGGAADVPGQFEFASPALIPPVGISPQTVVFIPQDGGTYSMVQGSVDVTVFPAENSAPFPIFMFNFGDEDYVGNNSPAHAEGTVPLDFQSWHTADATSNSKEVQLSGGNQTVTAEFRRANGTSTDAPVSLGTTSFTANRSGGGSGVFATPLTQSWRAYQRGGGNAGRSVGAYFTGLEPGEYDVYAIVHNPVLIDAGRVTNVGIGVGSATSGDLAWNDASLTGTSFAPSPQTNTWESGVNYARVRVEVTPENPNIYVIQGGPAAANDEFDYHTLTAVQIVAVQPDEPEPTDAYADWVVANNITGGPSDETGGVGNLMRYALGGDASTPLSALLPQMQSAADPEGLVLSLTFHRIDDPLINYSVWHSTDLIDWGASPVWDDFGAHDNVPGLFMIEIPTLHDRGFLRLEVTR